MKKNIFDKNRRRKKITILILIITFTAGFFMGWFSNNTIITEIELELENLNLDLRSFSEYLAFAEIFNIDTCDESFIEFIGRNIQESGATLDAMEREGKLDTPRYTILKQRHNINQVIFYSELKKFQENCEHEKNVILFFFDGEKPEDANKQGQVLNEIIKTRDAIVLAMDYGYTAHINYFYEYHEIRKLPTLIINYETKLEGHREKDEILNYLI